MDLRRIYFRTKEKILIKLHKPYMNTRISRLKIEGVTIGDDCYIFTDLTLSEPYLLHIGSNVTISNDCKFLTHDNSVIKFIEGKSDVVGRITIGDDCFIGANAIILPGVSLAKGTIVGAGSIVTKSVLEENQVIAGNPAKVVTTVEKMRTKYESIAFNISDMNKNERKIEILSNMEKMIIR